MNAPMVLSPDSLAKIEREVAKYPPDQKQSAVMAALAIAQKEKGWLSTETMDFVAAVLGMPPIAVYEVASFYTMYNLQPVGKYHLKICTNAACILRGADDLVEHCEKKLGIACGSTTADQLFTLAEEECLGACGTAPAMMLNDDYVENLTVSKMDEILARH